MKMAHALANTFGVLFLASLVCFVALAGLWATGILLPVQTVRWCLQLNAVASATLFAALLACLPAM